MKRLSLSMAVLGVLGLFVGIKSASSDFELPTLHKIQSVTLSPAYSCRSAEEFAKGYQRTALFLSDYARKRNGPDLLFNGACGADDYFAASTAGDDMSLVADLGADIPLVEVSAHRAFNFQQVGSWQAYSKFMREVKVQEGHTYAVLLNAQDKRGLFVFTVTEFVQDKSVTLNYAVLSYQVTPTGQVWSPGFDWTQKNAL